MALTRMNSEQYNIWCVCVCVRVQVQFVFCYVAENIMLKQKKSTSISYLHPTACSIYHQFTSNAKLLYVLE